MLTTHATMKVETPSLRAAFASVYPHHKRTKKDDDRILHRVRLIFGEGKLVVVATQGTTTGLAKLTITDDSRDGQWQPEDGPMIVDLQPRHVPWLNQWFSVKAAGDDVDQLIGITVDTLAGEIEFELIGALYATGERVRLQFDEPADGYPDVPALTVRALAEAAGKSEPARTLVQDGQVLELFKAASTQYKAQLRIRATGSGEHARGFVVEAGGAFTGTVSSETGGDEGVRRHAQWSQEMLLALEPAPTLVPA